jgi:hypothetical protein
MPVNICTCNQLPNSEMWEAKSIIFFLSHVYLVCRCATGKLFSLVIKYWTSSHFLRNKFLSSSSLDLMPYCTTHNCQSKQQQTVCTQGGVLCTTLYISHYLQVGTRDTFLIKVGDVVARMNIPLTARITNPGIWVLAEHHVNHSNVKFKLRERIWPQSNV